MSTQMYASAVIVYLLGIPHFQVKHKNIVNVTTVVNADLLFVVLVRCNDMLSHGSVYLHLNDCVIHVFSKAIMHTCDDGCIVVLICL